MPAINSHVCSNASPVRLQLVGGFRMVGITHVSVAGIGYPNGGLQKRFYRGARPFVPLKSTCSINLYGPWLAWMKSACSSVRKNC